MFIIKIKKRTTYFLVVQNSVFQGFSCNIQQLLQLKKKNPNLEIQEYYRNFEYSYVL